MDGTVTSAKICQGTSDYERDGGMQRTEATRPARSRMRGECGQRAGAPLIETLTLQNGRRQIWQ